MWNIKSSKNDLIASKDEYGVISEVMNFNYKLFGGKHVPDISLHNVRTVDKSNQVVDEDMLDVAPLSRIARSHIHKTPIHEVNVLQEIILENMCVKVSSKC